MEQPPTPPPMTTTRALSIMVPAPSGRVHVAENFYTMGLPIGAARSCGITWQQRRSVMGAAHRVTAAGASRTTSRLRIGWAASRAAEGPLHAQIGDAIEQAIDVGRSSAGRPSSSRA